MAANMKAVKLRIKSVQSTMQITKAMQLVAASKLRKAKEKADLSKPYLEVLRKTLIMEAETKGRDITVLPIGKKSVEHFKQKKVPIYTEDYAEVAKITISECFEIGRRICEAYREGQYGHIYLSRL